MAIASRLTNTGTLLVNGSFDEVTNAGNTSFATRTDSTGTVYTTNSTTGFDEVSYSASGGTGQLGINGINTGNNIVSYSQQFNQTSKWNSTGNVTVAINVTPAPENSLTGTKLTEDSVANTRHVITQNIPVTAGALSNTYSASVFAKAGERGNIAIGLKEYTGFTNQATAFFNLSTGTVGSLTASNGASVPTGNITPVGNNWYQCAMSTNLGNATATAIGMEISVANSSSNNTYTGDGTSGLYIWGAQTQQAAAATVYVATGPTANVNLNNFARRDVTTGVEFVYDNFDEVTWNPPIVTSGLALSLDSFNPASYNGTGLTWSDISGNGLIATLQSNYPAVYPAYTTSNQSFYTNSTNSTISFTVPTSSVLDSTSLTIEIWNQQVNYNNVAAFYGKYYNILSYRENYGVSGYRFGVDGSALTSGQPVFWTDQDAGNFSLQSSISIPVNTWYQTVVTYDSASSTCKIYVNGVLAGTNTSATYNAPTGQRLSLQAYSNGLYSANGYYSVFRQYNTSLSAADVKQNYNALCYRYGLATI